MTLGERFSAIDRFQRSRGFKIGASIVVLALFLAYVGFAIVGSTTGDAPIPELSDQALATPEVVTDGQGTVIENRAKTREQQVRAIVDTSRSPVSGIVGAAAAAGFAMLVVWMGLGITYLGAIAIMGAAGAVLYTRSEGTLGTIAFVVVGMTVLLLCFSVLVRALTLALSPAHPVLAIARNVLAEAIRMKISLVFILVLAFLLAAMPMVLDADQSLRYRVQGFLQWSTGLSFWLIALLVVFFSVATVSYEQREKVIFQTMTKPVAAWQYILGKWLGVTLLSGVLLCVSGVGVYQFTEYLRTKPAKGEVEPYVPLDSDQIITEDRLILETQVLTARRTTYPYLPYSPDSPEFDAQVEEEIRKEKQLQSDYNPTPAQIAAIRKKIYDDAVSDYRSIDPRVEGYQTFVFGGLGDAKRLGRPLTLRYKINAEGNRPDVFYRLTFVFEDGTILPPRETGLGFSHTVTIDNAFINNAGEIRMQIYNGALGLDRNDNFMLQPNPNTMTIPPDGLEISYPVGSYTANFARVMGVLWVKLGLLSMIAIWAATFASFPVASLMSFTVFFIAEGSGFVQEALPAWDRTNDSALIETVRNVIYYIADTISSFFLIYSNLRPTGRLAAGMALGWGEVSAGVLALGAATLVFFGLGVSVFRSRQLAIYSGH